MTSLFRVSLLAALLVMAGCADDQAANSVATDASDSAGSDTAAPAADAGEGSGTSESTESTDADSGLLGPGSPAPQMHVAKWMKGDAFEGYDEGQVYVVEFWATWCPPCIASMPHLASLQDEYGDKVKFVGVTAEDEATVSGFFEKESPQGKPWNEVLTYRIALDDSRQTNTNFLEAANQGGIPCAFIVGRTGNVEWIGHPVEIDEPLQMVVDGSWDSTAARDEFMKSMEFEKDMMAFQAKVGQAQQSSDYKKAAALCDEFQAKYPEMTEISGFKMQILMQGDMIAELNETAAAIVKSSGDDPMILQAVASMMTLGSDSEERDLDIALEAAAKAVELTEEKEIPPLDALARVYFQKGDIASAVEWQKKAVALGPEMSSLKKELEKYEAALSADADK